MIALPVAAAVAGGAALAGWRAGALTPGGAAAAWLVGLGILAGAGWGGAAVLAAFFASSTLLGRLVPGDTAPGLDPKGNCRDHWQVLANGGAAMLAAWLLRDRPALALWPVATSLAAAAADTWATTWGLRSAAPPRHLLTGRPVPAGTNGGVTLLGSAGGLAGAALVGLTAAGFGGIRVLWAALLIGWLGMLGDSAIGALWQGRFYCDSCGTPSEWRRHRCGRPTRPVGGWAWLNNDGVNAAATGLAAVAGWAAWRCCSGWS